MRVREMRRVMGILAYLIGQEVRLSHFISQPLTPTPFLPTGLAL